MKFDYSEQYLLDGFKFFEIFNKEFINKTIETAKFITENHYESNVDEFLTKICENGMAREFDGTLWGLKPEDLGIPLPENSYIAAVLMIATWQLHKANMISFGLDEFQTKKNKERFASTVVCDVERSNLACPRMNRFTWGLKFVNCKIIEIGSLQFDFNFGGINFHIPYGSKIDKQSIIKTIKDGIPLVEKYFGLKNAEYRCNSWLLSPQIYALSRENSNIRAFADMFDIKEGADCIFGVKGFLFNDPLCKLKNEDLPQDSGLQKSVKEHLLQGKEINLGMGILKSVYIKGDE